MTFRPSDDVIDSIENGQQSLGASNQYSVTSNESVSDNGSRVFSNPDAEERDGSVTENVDIVGNSQVEEVKAPDLSELLEKSEEGTNMGNGESNDKVKNDGDGEDFTVDLSEIDNGKGGKSSKDDDHLDENENNGGVGGGGLKQGDEESIDTGKMPDSEREEIVSGIEGSIHSKLDFLVDNEWKSVVEVYKKIYRILFRWGVFILIVILGVLGGIMVQVKANQSNGFELIRDSSIENINTRKENNSDKILSSEINKDNRIEPIISYGSISFTTKSFQSKSNLIKYQGIVLPQLISLDLNSTNFISLDEFAKQETSREDLESMVKYLITGDSIYNRTLSLPNVMDSLWKGKTFQGGLIDGFGLGCVKNNKLGDFVCDKLLERFYKYGKYYDLSLYSSDVLILVRELNRQNKDIKPICTMIEEYIWHSGVISADILGSVMNFCPEEDFSYYRKMVNFIDIDNSLRQPELLDKVFDDPDLNAYKLLSAQQIVYRSLRNSTINEGFIKSYLNFVQNLLNKDNQSGRYLSPIYKDLLYVFNTDVLYATLIEKGKLSADLNSQLDQINNGNPLLGYPSLKSQLTTPGIVRSGGDYVIPDDNEETLEDLFARFYRMTDRLQIRRTVNLSDTDMQVQTEIFSDDIIKVTGGPTLKATVVLHRKQNALYVKTINISNQRSLSETLNIYAADGNVRFDAMLGYIDEQIGFWYKEPGQDSEVEFTLCNKLEGIDDIQLYTCDESSIVLYKGDIEYAFTLLNGILESFVISDVDIESALKEKLKYVMTSRENTSTIIESILDFELEKPEETNIEKKLEIIDQFRIHLKLVPTISDIEGEDDIFMVEFSIGDFNLEAIYNIDTHLLTKISYVACEKTLEIRNLTIEVSSDNESQLTEILNNPRIFFANANAPAYRKYQRMCD